MLSLWIYRVSSPDKKVSRLQNTKYGLGPQGLRVVFTVPYDSRKPSETLRPSEGHEGVETFSPSGAKNYMALGFGVEGCRCRAYGV